MATPFPFVRLRRNVALIGLCSGLPQPLHKAAGMLGVAQIETAGALLRELRERGYCRIVLIHHPPLPGLAPPRKALVDAAYLREILEREGAELVLHGHNHVHMLNALRSRFGTVRVIGVPSASMALKTHHDLASWYLYRVVRAEGRWNISVTVRAWDALSRQFHTVREFALPT